MKRTSQSQDSMVEISKVSSIVTDDDVTETIYDSETTLQLQGRLVRFDESRNVCTKVAANAKYASVCWLGAVEMATYKKAALAQSQEIALSPSEAERSYRRVLTRVYKACCDASSSDATASTSKSTISLSQVESSILSEKDQADLTRIIVKSNSRSGLERTVMERMKMDVLQRRKLVQKTCLSVQQAMDTIPPNMRSTMIRQSMEPLSRQSRILAHELALAIANIQEVDKSHRRSSCGLLSV